MNLAEIRKKAVEARKPEIRETSGETADLAPEVAADDRDAFGSDGYESPEEEYFPEDAGDAARDEFAGFELEEAELAPLAPAEEAPGEELSFMDEREFIPEDTDIKPFQNVPPPSIDRAVSANAIPPATAVRHPAYDPVATLLAGRRAAVGEEEAAADEERVHVSGDMEEYLCFKVADEEYALSIMDIKEIIKPREVTEVPRMPKFVSGVISLRGVIIPIIDIRLRLSLPVGKQTGRERILVLRTSAGYSGVLVDEVIQVVRLQQGDIEGPPAILDGIDREFVMGLGRFEQRMLILLNLDSILNLDLR